MTTPSDVLAPVDLSGFEEHTPGPWAYGLDDVDAVWAVTTPEDGGNVICEPPPSKCAASLSRWPANARLIAAAPALLSELKSLREEVNRLRAEVAKLSNPTIFWDAEDPETGYGDIFELIEANICRDEIHVVEVQCAAYRPNIWAVGWLDADDDLQIEEFATKAEADAAHDARQALRLNPKGK